MELLKALGSNKNEERQKAEAMYKQAKSSEPGQLVIGLISVLGQEGADDAVRDQAAVLLRQLCDSSRSESEFAFGKLGPEHRQEVAAELLRRFEAEKNSSTQKKVGDIVAELADGACNENHKAGWINPAQCGWPAVLPLVFRMADPSTNPNVVSCESSLRLVRTLVSAMGKEIVQAQQQLGVVLQHALMHADAKVRCAAFLLVCKMVEELEKKDWVPLLSTVGILMQVMQQLAQANLEPQLVECIGALIDVGGVEPDFFKPQLASSLEPANLFATLCKKQDAPSAARNLALEWLVAYLEKKPKFLMKSLPAFVQLTLESCMAMMLSVESAEEDLVAWAGRMDDEEGEEDADEVFHTGEEAIDRVADKLTMDGVGTPLFALIGQFVQQDAWQAKHAALAAIKQTVEYVEDRNHMTEMAKLLLQHVDHPHPRVRHIALFALGQLAHDQKPHFQETWHATVMPVLLQKFDDPVDRVAEMSMSAFVNFGEELDETLMQGYSSSFMEKLVGRLRTTNHRGVREESITAIAVIAGVMQKGFAQYYDVTMPMLKQVVLKATGEKENRLRGKAFECMSLLGVAMGKEKFLPDAKEAISEMVKVPLEADDVQREYLKEAFERICHCLKKDFALFLPTLLPGIYRTLRLDAEDPSSAAPDDDDDYIEVATGEGKLVKVKSSRFEELAQSVSLLHSFCEEMEGAFFDWVQPTAEALMPLMSMSDEQSLLCDDAKATTFQVFAELIKVAKTGAAERGVAPDMAQQLIRTVLPLALKTMDEEKDPENIGDTASGIAECLRNAGPGALQGDETLQLIRKFCNLIDESFERCVQFESARQKEKAGAPPELQGDEDEEANDPLEDERDCRTNLADTLGAVMKVSPEQFLQCLSDLGQKMQQWLTTKHKALVLHLACDLLNHLKDQSCPLWPVFMPEVFRSLNNVDPDVRTPAFYAINLAAPLQNFAEAAPEAFRQVTAVLSAPSAKKRADKESKERALIAQDNAVAALLILARDKAAQCPPEVQAWPLIVSKLPLKNDEEEAVKVHTILVDLVLAQHAGLLGPDRANLGKILSVLAEVYGSESLSNKETDEKILRIFRLLQREHLVALAGSFTEKQQKRIEKMLAQGAAS